MGEVLSTGNFGVDKLHVSLSQEDFEVKDLSPSAGWCINSTLSPENPDPQVLGISTDTGERVYGSKAYSSLGGVILDINPRGLFMKINPSKSLHPYLLSGSESIESATAQMLEAATKLGVRYDTNRMKLSRVDLCRQSELSESPAQYERAYNSLSGKRLRPVKEPNTFYFRNGHREVAFYGKQRELKAKTGETYGCPDNLVRCEAKFKRHVSCTSALQVTFAHQLAKYSNGDLQRLHSSYVGENVFRIRKEGTQSVISFERLTDLLDQKYKEQSRGSLAAFQRVLGAEVILSEFMSLDNYRDFLLDQGKWHRTTVWRHVDALSQDLKAMKPIRDAERPVSSLLAELREAFVDLAA